jgi:hypothetical protein
MENKFQLFLFFFIAWQFFNPWCVYFTGFSAKCKLFSTFVLYIIICAFFMRRLLTIIVVLFSVQCFSQTDIQDDYSYSLPYKNSYFTGGSLGMQFGSVVMIDVSPQIGYYPLEHIAIGAGFTYQYISDRRYAPRVDIHVYGGRAFTRLYLPLFESLFAHLEYEYMAYRTNMFNINGDMEWIKMNNFLAGAGYRQRIGGRSAINLMLLWNFNESEYSLYSNPVFRIGADIGL